MRFLFLLIFLCHPAFAEECFPQDKAASFNVPERYSKLPPDLLDVLRESYFKHTKSNAYLDNAFWGTDPDDKCTWPGTLWEGLDKMGPTALYTMVSIFQKTRRAMVWNSVGHIRNAWYGTSFGITFDGVNPDLSELVEYFKKSGGFCKDSETISKAEHEGQICWRQVATDSKGAGLHFCYGAGKSPEIHIDHTQVALGKIPLTDTCLYNPMAVVKHYQEIRGKRPRTIFDFIDEERALLERQLREAESSCQGMEKYLFKLNWEKFLNTLSKEKMMAIASLGESAPEKATAIYRRVQNEKGRFLNFLNCACAF